MVPLDAHAPPTSGGPRVTTDKPVIAYTVVEAARACGVSPSTVRAAIAKGDLPANKVGTKTLLLPTDLESWVRGSAA